MAPCNGTVKALQFPNYNRTKSHESVFDTNFEKNMKAGNATS